MSNGDLVALHMAGRGHPFWLPKHSATSPSSHVFRKFEHSRIGTDWIWKRCFFMGGTARLTRIHGETL
jgi:hypothetical protein